MGVVTAAVIGAAGAIGGAAISAGSANSQSKAAMRARQQAYENASGYISGLFGKGDAWLAQAFGDQLNPEAFLYEKVDLTQSQLDTIQGNLKALPSAKKLTNKVNPVIWANDMNRIRTMMPGFDRARDSYIGTTRKLQEGQLPFEDIMDVFSTSSSAAAAMAPRAEAGTPPFAISASPASTP